MLPAGDAVRGSNGTTLIGCEGSKPCFEGEKLPEGLEKDSGRDSADRSIILGRLLTLGRQVVGSSELEYTSSDIWGQRVTTSWKIETSRQNMWLLAHHKSAITEVAE